jgi:hypothetical protein
MKRLTSMGLAILLATGGGAALADRGHGDDHHGGHGPGYGKGYEHHYHEGHWYPRPYYPRPYYYPRPHYDREYYYPLGAALIGAAVTYSLFHTHDGARCYENHVVSYSAPAASAEVVGCHRIERYPDGSERRVEVPVSECY